VTQAIECGIVIAETPVPLHGSPYGVFGERRGTGTDCSDRNLFSPVSCHSFKAVCSY
jgi:hypothetical protein